MTKLNQLLAPHLKVRQKQGYIFLEGDKSRISIVNAAPMMRDMLCLLNRLYSTEPGSLRDITSLPRNTEQLSVENKSYTRSELQSLWGISKSQALILIERYLANDAIRKVGVGKATRYIIHNLSHISTFKH
jgi:hypothetical protein